MKKVKVAIPGGYGLNCNYETMYSVRLAGGEPDNMHLNELVNREKSLEDYQMLVMIGGFSFGDDHGSGVLEACKLKYNIGEDIHTFIEDGKLILAICNGFQAGANYGMLPGFDGDYDSIETSLLANAQGNFRNDWITLEMDEKSPCVFTKGIKRIDLPVRHGEGNFFAEPPVIKKLVGNDQIVARYVKGDELVNDRFYNPNGALHDIAGICDQTGRIFGLMPHPEAYNDPTNHPYFTIRKEKIYKRKGIPIPEEGDGIQIFRNGVEYAIDNLI